MLAAGCAWSWRHGSVLVRQLLARLRSRAQIAVMSRANLRALWTVFAEADRRLPPPATGAGRCWNSAGILHQADIAAMVQNGGSQR